MNPYKRTYETNPELWDQGLSYLAKIEYENGAQSIFAGGWHLRQIQFEHPNIKMIKTDEDEAYKLIGLCELETSRLWSSIKAFEVEISLDKHHDTEATALLARFLEPTTASRIIDSMQEMNMRVSANRSDSIISDSAGNDIMTIDLLCQNLPSRSGDIEEPLRTLSRWCRVFALKSGTVTVYQALDSQSMTNLRWPHNCIWLNRPSLYFKQKTGVGSITEAVCAPISYESYNLDNWRLEFALWENKPLQLMLRNESNETTARFVQIQQELGILSEFVATASLSTRNLKRRIDNNALMQSDSKLLETAKELCKKQMDQIEEYRGELRYASGLLANSAQSVQAIVNQERADVAEKTNTLITFVSALFLVPTLIISFFSMSIIDSSAELVSSSILFVLALCLISMALTTLVIVFTKTSSKRNRRQ